MKRATLALLLVLACGTAPSGATFATNIKNDQAFSAAADFGVHVSMVDPQSPKSGSVLLKANASETAGGTITQVVFERSPTGAGTWTTACTDNSSVSGWECNWTTSGSSTYDIRARATSSSGYSRTSQPWTGLVIDNSAPSVQISDPGDWFRTTIQMGTTTLSDTGGSGLASVDYHYKATSGSTWTLACSSSTTPYTCNFNPVTAGLTSGNGYDFRATAKDGAGHTATSTVTNRGFDNTIPTGAVTLTDVNVRGIVAVPTSAADTGSGVASITVQYSVAGANSWSQGCIKTSSPWQCNWDTTGVTSQLYDLRVVVLDVAGNQHTSTTLANRRVDNVAPTMTLSLPATNPLTGTISMSATAADNSGGTGVKNVAFQYSAAGTGGWTNACAPITPPTAYSCGLNSTGLTDGLYDFRVQGLDNLDNAGYAEVLNRRIDNYTPSASDVQTTDVGGTPGRIQIGDSLTLTYSEAIDPATLVTGWNGQTQLTIYARLTHHNQGDRFMFYTTSGLTTVIPFAASPGVVLNEDFVGSSGTTLPATLTRSTDGESFTIAFTAVPGVNATQTPAATMRWTPSTSARDFANKAVSNTTRDETGATVDRDF